MEIKIDALSLSSVAIAASNVTAYLERLKKLETDLPRVLAEFGRDDAIVRFATGVGDILVSGMFEPPKGITVTAQPTDNGYKVIANGAQVCFVEFGAGVYYNGAESYLGKRPAGIVGIGQFGHKRGSNDKWAFRENGEVIWTHGTPANNCLFYASQEMRRKVEEEARRILNGDD